MIFDSVLVSCQSSWSPRKLDAAPSCHAEGSAPAAPCAGERLAARLYLVGALYGGAQFVLGLSVSRSPRHTLHTEGRPTRSHFVQCMHARWNGDQIGLYKRE